MSNRITIGLQEIGSYLSEQSSMSIDVDATNDADVLSALKNDEPFPNRDIEIGKIAVGTKDGQDIKFETETGVVTFKGAFGANAYSGLGVYRSSVDLVSELGMEEKINPSIQESDGDNSLFTLFRWGYDISSELSGTVALANPAHITFGADGRHESLFAVVRRIPVDTGARTAVKDTVNSWKLPSQISGIDQLQPGTWLISEVESGVGFKLGGELGYDFSWVKEAEMGGLNGDIGLRLQLGLETAVNFHVAGKFAVVVARESDDPSDKKLRLQLFKLRKKGWNFSLDSGAEVENVADILPGQSDDFLKAVFGVHGEQIIKDLKDIERWTDPEEDLPDLLYGAGSGYAKEIIGAVTGADLSEAFTEAKKKVLDFIKKWEELDHELASRLWNLTEDNIEVLGEIEDLADTITKMDHATAKKFIGDLLADVEFFNTAKGKFLSSLITQERLFAALTDTGAFRELKAKAVKVSEILDGGPVQELFKNLQKEINARLNLNVVKEEIGEADIEDLDELLKAKLKDFLGEDNLTLQKIEQVRKTIDLLLKKRQEFYNKAVKALNRKYQFSLNSTYQKTTGNQALLDVTFDFKQGDESELQELLQQALNGQFDRIFIQKYEGVIIGAGTLTHRIERSSTVELSLPFYKSTVRHINKSLADAEAVDEDEGRVLVYELDAKDTVTRKNRRISSLSIGGFFKSSANRVRLFSDASLSYSYSFIQYTKNMNRSDLEYQLEPYIKSYFKTLFNQSENDHLSRPFTDWLSDLDMTIDRYEQNGSNNFGHTFLSLDINLSARVASAWLQVPEDEKDPRYMEMSRNIQAALKRIIPFYYFADVNNFRNKTPAKILLAYTAIPPSTDLEIYRGDLRDINNDNDIYWDWVNKKRQAEMLLYRQTAVNLSKLLFKTYSRLEATPGMSRDAEFYSQDKTLSILSEMATGIRNDNIIENNFYNLFYCEKHIIKGAHKAALKLAEFLNRADSKPTEAVKALSEFGTVVTESFNNRLKQNYGEDALRPLGTLLFIEAARAFDPKVVDDNIRSMLNLVVLKKTVTDTYLDLEDIPDDQILLSERLIN